MNNDVIASNSQLFSTQMSNNNPDLGWFFYHPVEGGASSQETEGFAYAFGKFLNQDIDISEKSNLIISSEHNYEASQSSAFTTDRTIIMFKMHGGVYFPARYFSQRNNPKLFRDEVELKLNQFKESVGKDWAHWRYEQDSVAYASSDPISDSQNSKNEETPTSNTHEVGLVSKNQGDSLAKRVIVYWHLLKVMSEPLWPFGQGEGVKIAVLDTGVDLNNHLLAEGNIGGTSCVPGVNSYHDDNGHGTHVTGIISSRPGTDSDSGLPLYWSIAPGSKHYAVKVLNRNGRGDWSWIANGIDLARGQGVDIINMSLGGGRKPPEVVQRAINLASENQVVIAAAGNNGPGLDTVTWPARYFESIGVGAVDRNLNIANFSSRGPNDPNAYVEEHVETVAPGVKIFSNLLGGASDELIRKNGTSMAAPIVSGICALLKQKDFTLKGTDDFRYRLRHSYIDLGINGPDNFYGMGLVYFDQNS